MSDTTTIGTWIGVAATAVSAIATIATAYLRSRMKEKLAAIQQGGTAAQRVVADAVTSFRLNTAKLSSKQVFELAKAEIASRDRRHSRNLRLSAGFAAIAATTTVVLAIVVQRPATGADSGAYQSASRSVVSAIQEVIGASQRYFRLGNYSAGAESPERAITQLDNVLAENEDFLDSVSVRMLEPDRSIVAAIRRADETILVAASSQEALDNGERAVMTRQEVSTNVKSAIQELERNQALIREYKP